MKKTLGGICFTRNCWRFDYCFMECIQCLLDLCDNVVVVDVGSDDGTVSSLRDMEAIYEHRMMVISVSNEHWVRGEGYGKERISMYQNLAKSFLDTDYYILLQADEIIHENSFQNIKTAINEGAEGYILDRINLWGSSETYINVPELRQPCSTKVVRIAKLKYDSVDDGEGISVANPTYIHDAAIFHYGFVRKKSVMKEKIENMQAEVFRITPDPKLYLSDEFDSTLWFKDEDLSPLTLSHPKYIINWIKSRP